MGYYPPPPHAMHHPHAMMGPAGMMHMPGMMGPGMLPPGMGRGPPHPHGDWPRVTTKRRRTGRGGSASAHGHGGRALPKPRKTGGNRRGDGRKDASKAEQFLTYMRENVNPTGDKFRQFVHDVNTGLSDNNDLGRAMKRFDTRPKYVLRKLCFSILPETSAKREAFARDVLKLGGKVSTQQREAIKTDLITMLLAICEHAPSMARIPCNYNQKT